MATSYYYKNQDVNDVFAKCRSGINCSTNVDNLKNKYTETDNGGTHDLATLGFVQCPNDSSPKVLQTLCADYVNTSFSPLRLLPKGCAPMIETNMANTNASTFTAKAFEGPYTQATTYVYTLDFSDNTKINYTYIDTNGIYDEWTTAFFDYFYYGKNTLRGFKTSSSSTINMPSGYKVPQYSLVQMCGGGGGGAASHGDKVDTDYYGGGGGSGAFVLGAMQHLPDSTYNIIVGPGGKPGAPKGRDTNYTGHGTDGGSSCILITSQLHSNWNIMNTNYFHYYYFKLINCGGGKAGKAQQSNNHGTHGNYGTYAGIVWLHNTNPSLDNVVWMDIAVDNNMFFSFSGGGTAITEALQEAGVSTDTYPYSESEADSFFTQKHFYVNFINRGLGGSGTWGSDISDLSTGLVAPRMEIISKLYFPSNATEYKGTSGQNNGKTTSYQGGAPSYWAAGGSIIGSTKHDTIPGPPDYGAGGGGADKDDDFWPLADGYYGQPGGAGCCKLHFY